MFKISRHKKIIIIMSERTYRNGICAFPGLVGLPGCENVWCDVHQTDIGAQGGSGVLMWSFVMFLSVLWSMEGGHGRGGERVVLMLRDPGAGCEAGRGSGV